MMAQFKYKLLLLYPSIHQRYQTDKFSPFHILERERERGGGGDHVHGFMRHYKTS